MRKSEKGGEMYFCKLAPHKSDMQPSREKAAKRRDAHTHIRGEREGGGLDVKIKLNV